MGLDLFKNKVGSWMEKKIINEEEQKELGNAFQKFDDAYVQSPHLDDMIRDCMENIRGGLLEKRSDMTEEMNMLQEERTSLGEEIKNELAKLNEARAKLEDVSKGKYGGSFHDALNACNNCIRDYESLLELMEMNSSQYAGDVGAMTEAYQRESTYATELQVREQAINMLVSITPSQREAVRYYTGDGSKYINPALREGHRSDSDYVNKSICELHGLLKNYHTPVPVTLYRGVSSDVTMVNGNKKGLDQFSDAELCGKLLSDRAFVSTSLRENDAFNKQTVLVLNAPAGTCGAYVGDFGAMGNMESEFLMDCGQLFRVTNVERRDGKRYIYANVLVKQAK